MLLVGSDSLPLSFVENQITKSGVPRSGVPRSGVPRSGVPKKESYRLELEVFWCDRENTSVQSYHSLHTGY